MVSSALLWRPVCYTTELRACACQDTDGSCYTRSSLSGRRVGWPTSLLRMLRSDLTQKHAEVGMKHW